MVEPTPERSDDTEIQHLNSVLAAQKSYHLKLAHPIAAPLKRHRTRRFYGLSSLAAFSVIGVGILAWLISTQLHNKFSVASIAVSAAKASVEKTVPLAGQSTGRTNFLVYGMTKDGLRTDSIMLASYYYQQKKLVTINIPRDLYVNDGYENAKMGEVYAYAKLRQPHNTSYPDQFVSDLISKEYGIPVNYWTELNMQGEVSLINSIGGVDVIVQNAFTDYEYPKWNYNGYVRPAPSFVAGPQHMDGDTALVFSRSRHSLDNSEGSDFARSKRQALVLSSIMTKVKSQGLIDNVGKLSQYLGIVSQNVRTTMSTDELLSAAKLMKGLNPTSDHLIGNWNTGNGFLCDARTPGGADIVLYGVPGFCTAEAIGSTTATTSTNADTNNVRSVYPASASSIYRQDAITYIQNLLQSAQPPAAAPTGASASATTATQPATGTPAKPSN